MITVYKHIEEELVSDSTVSDATKGSWVNLVNPDPDELSLINILTEIPTDVLKTALDMEERSHVELEDNYIFVVINIPAIRGNDMYDTVPLGIFLTPDFFITVCLEESEVLYPFISNQLSTFYTYKKTRFLFQILYRTATLFLRYLQQINRRTDDIEVQLRHTTKNKDFFQLLELQKSMTYFTSALRTNGTVMERLLRLRGHSSYKHLLKMYEEDEDLLMEVQDKIKGEKMPAARALKEGIDEYCEMISQLDDAYLRERAADLQDIGKRWLKNLLGMKIHDLSNLEPGTIVVTEDLTPSDTAQLDLENCIGFITEVGGKTAHSAIMARSLKKGPFIHHSLEKKVQANKESGKKFLQHLHFRRNEQRKDNFLKCPFPIHSKK